MASAHAPIRSRWTAGGLGLFLVLLCLSPALAWEEQEAQEAVRSFRLGQELLNQGDLDAALAAARRALAIQQRIYGPENLETAQGHALVGQVLYARDDLEGAFEAMRRALDISDRTLGSGHPDSATFLAFLAIILNKRGDLDGALHYQRSALRILEANPGSDYDNAIQALANLGTTLYQRGELEEALEVTQEALQRDEKLFGPDHARVAQRYRNLGRIHLKLGDLDAALQNTRQAHQIFQRTLKAGDPEIAMTVSALGMTFQEKGDLDAALRFHQSALQIDERNYGPDHSRVATRLNNLAGVLLQKGDLQGALKAAQRALRIDEKPSSLDGPDVARDSDTLARILLAKGDLDGALKASKRALSIDESTFGKDHPEVARDSDTLAAILLERGETDAALRSARRALDIGQKAFGPDLPVVAQYSRRAGLVLQEKGDLAGARSHFERALRIYQKKYGPDHPRTRQSAADLRLLDERREAASRKILAIVALVLLGAAAVAGLFFYRRRRRVPATQGPSSSGSVSAGPSASGVLGTLALNEASDDTPVEGLTRIGPYRLEERLGAGGMGVVYRAYDERLDRRVAVKIIPPGKSRDPQRRERLRREAQASARLSHPSIVQIHDFVQTDEIDGIVMELVDGIPLSRLLWQGPLDLYRALQVARDITDALAEAHSKGIIHRDLKSENVIITPSGRAKILDFGIAKRVDREDPALTTEGAVIGTYRAMAPEQAQGHEMDHRADLFALGTLFYEMFTGQSPFLGSTAADTLWRICCHQQAPARTANPRVPEELSEAHRPVAPEGAPATPPERERGGGHPDRPGRDLRLGFELPDRAPAGARGLHVLRALHAPEAQYLTEIVTPSEPASPPSRPPCVPPRGRPGSSD